MNDAALKGFQNGLDGPGYGSHPATDFLLGCLAVAGERAAHQLEWQGCGDPVCCGWREKTADKLLAASKSIAEYVSL